MARIRKSLIWSLGALLIMGGLWGCNGSDIDDPDVSDSLLIVDSVDPSTVQSVVSGSADPNNPAPPADDFVNVKVRNLNRSQSPTGIFGDIQISSLDLDCNDPLLNQFNTPTSLTIPAQSSVTISVALLDGATKFANQGTLLGIGSTRCGVTFNGQDLGGEPIRSQEAFFIYSFVDVP